VALEEETLVRYRKTILLFLIAALLGGFYFLYLLPRIEKQRLIKELENRFFRSDTEVIDYIRIQAGPSPPYELKKTKKGWVIVKPRLLQVDMGAIRHFMETLSEGKVIKVVSGTKSLRDLGIKQIYSVIAIGYGGDIDVLYVGEENPARTGYYAFSERLKSVFLIDKETAQRLYLTLYDMREKRLFPFEKERIGKIVIRRRDDTVELKRNKQGWDLIQPVRFPGNSEEIESLLEILVTQKAEAFIAWNKEIDALKKSLWIGVYGLDGDILSSGELRYWGTDWDKQSVFRKDGEEEAIRVSRAFWLLLSSHASRFTSNVLFTLKERRDITSIEINNEGKEYIFKQKDEGMEISTLIDTLSRQAYDKILFQKRYPFGEEFFSIRIKDKHSVEFLRVSRGNLQKEVSSSFMFVPVRPGSPEKRMVKYYLVQTNRFSYQAVINSEVIRTIMDVVEKYARK
jgi:hypothetical protein